MHDSASQRPPTRFAAIPWFVLATTAAFGLAISMHAAVLDDTAVGFPTLLVRVFALIAGAIGTVRHIGRRPGEPRRWLGLPPRDWAFTGAFALVATLGFWLLK